MRAVSASPRMRRRITPAGSVRQAPDLDELESEGLHALEDAVQLGLVADAPVQDGLDALDVALERVEAGEQGGADAAADAELVLRRGHDAKLPRRRGDDESPARVIAGLTARPPDRITPQGEAHSPAAVARSCSTAKGATLWRLIRWTSCRQKPATRSRE